MTASVRKQLLLILCLMAGRGKLFKVCYGRTLASNCVVVWLQGLEESHLQESAICCFIAHLQCVDPVRFDDVCLQSKPEDT